jgi:ferric-dicitrate binding protein FerR (iron transport regulator)
MPAEEQILELLRKWRLGVASTQEMQELLDLLEDSESTKIIDPVLKNYWLEAKGEFADYPGMEDGVSAILRTFPSDNRVADIASKQKSVVPIFRKLGWAAVIVFALGVGLFKFLYHKPENPIAKQSPILPGKQGAILTLADGSTVSLDSIKNGVIATQGGATAKVVNGKLMYEVSGNEVVYNTMTTPRGRQFQMDLPDGSQVWLNANSSITYPTVFAGNERKVKIKGEAFIEVVKNSAKIFKVNVNDRDEIEVLGTSFNVEAYDDEDAIKTTLLEGAVKVSLKNKERASTVALKPGQQAGDENEELRLVNDVDINKVIAWKRGVFNFDDADLQTTMKQLARWYDVDIEYEGKVPAKTFGGEISRNVPLSKVLEMLAYTRVHFKVEGRKIIVTK